MADDLRSILASTELVSRGCGPMRFTWSDVLAMSAAGWFGELDRPELIDGEIIIMPFEGPLHRQALQVLQRWSLANISKDHELSIRNFLQVLGSTTYFIPDLVVLAANFMPKDCTVLKADLIIEVSDTTLEFDLTQKLKSYAQAGASEYWVVDTNAQSIIVHREPSGESYRSVQKFIAGQLVAPLCATSAGFDPAMLPNPADYIDA